MKAGTPNDSFGCIPLESVIECVCIVRIPWQVVGKRWPAACSDAGDDPKDDDSTTGFVINNQVEPSEELLPVVPDEVEETVRGEGWRCGCACMSQASEQLEAAMDAKEVKAWGCASHQQCSLTGLVQ